jgi:hypothetical protein
MAIRLCNWDPSLGNFADFAERNLFTGWVGDITRDNFLIDQAESYNIVSNYSIRQLFRSFGDLLGVAIPENDITALLNMLINDLNNRLFGIIGNNTQAVTLAGIPPKYTTVTTSFILNGKKYTRGALKFSQIDYGIDFSNLPSVNTLSDIAKISVVAELKKYGIFLNTAQTIQLKDILTGIIELIFDILKSITDKVDLYDYSEDDAPPIQPIYLQITDTIIGTGNVVSLQDFISIRYSCWLYDAFAEQTRGRSIVSSTRLDITLDSNQLITGLVTGLAGIKSGGRRALIIPSSLSYSGSGSAPGIVPPMKGTRAFGQIAGIIPSNTALVFDIELIPNTTFSYAKDTTNTWRRSQAVWVKGTPDPNWEGEIPWTQAKVGWIKTSTGWQKIYQR